ncbi:MAG: PEP/pyruvate-binding domain-containing protein [Anaerolineales bacterium]|nr:PEP/pyruvate-binding domain-containing protein [Anaerolineales bacterium]
MYTIRLDEITANDLPVAGNKALGLANLLRMGVNVPGGFVVTTAVFQQYLEYNALDPSIPIENFEQDVERLARTLLTGAIPLACEEAIKTSYTELQGRITTHPYVVVRSSSNLEDMQEFSFAGQYASFLGVGDWAGLRVALRQCWASQYSYRAFEYFQSHHLPLHAGKMSVIVQQMIPAEKAGVMLTSDPISRNNQTVVIEANWGLGETVVSGQVTPDHIQFDTHQNKSTTYLIGSKAMEIVFLNGQLEHRAVPPERQQVRCLADAEIMNLVQIGKKIENQANHPVEIEWAISDNTIFFLQTRSVTG